jgi:hypothetical protein
MIIRVRNQAGKAEVERTQGQPKGKQPSVHLWLANY